MPCAIGTKLPGVCADPWPAREGGAVVFSQKGHAFCRLALNSAETPSPATVLRTQSSAPLYFIVLPAADAPRVTSTAAWLGGQLALGVETGCAWPWRRTLDLQAHFGHVDRQRDSVRHAGANAAEDEELQS